MMPSCLVIDSNVFAKSFLDEGDQDLVKDLFRYIAQQDLNVLCPDIFLYEVLSIAAQNSFPVHKALRLLRSFESSYLQIMPLTDRQLDLALRMAEDGNDKSGYPSIYDSAYHALAISCQGVFITADKRHISKTSNYDNVILLSDWKDELQRLMDI